MTGCLEGRHYVLEVQQALIALTQEIISTAFQYVFGRCFAGIIVLFGAVNVPKKCSDFLRKEQARNTDHNRKSVQKTKEL